MTNKYRTRFQLIRATLGGAKLMTPKRFFDEVFNNNLIYFLRVSVRRSKASAKTSVRRLNKHLLSYPIKGS